MIPELDRKPGGRTERLEADPLPGELFGARVSGSAGTSHSADKEIPIDLRGELRRHFGTGGCGSAHMLGTEEEDVAGPIDLAGELRRHFRTGGTGSTGTLHSAVEENDDDPKDLSRELGRLFGA